ncbi:hypothetical protein [Nocardioides sambongensis]|uniref:hypothetical protein n=1 Tax=Nocardioides sambongensis TaxID=2589074 RepID=UPI0011271936|nr:hypothetical protein [Nocardioides sambongensis]
MTDEQYDAAADPAAPDPADAGPPDAGPTDAERRAADWRRRRRLAEIFGDPMPETTRDEREPAPGGPGESASDRWLKSQVPPHHGG